MNTPAIKVADWFAKATVTATVVMGVLFAFLHHESRTVRLLFFLAFFFSASTAATGALLVAAHELKQRGLCGAVMFFGCLGTTMLLTIVVMLSSLAGGI